MLQVFVPALPHLESCLERQDEAPVLPTPLDPLLAHSFSRRKSPAAMLSKRPSRWTPVYCIAFIYFTWQKWL